jgi:hypothetical protein
VQRVVAVAREGKGARAARPATNGALVRVAGFARLTAAVTVRHDAVDVVRGRYDEWADVHADTGDVVAGTVAGTDTGAQTRRSTDSSSCTSITVISGITAVPTTANIATGDSRVWGSAPPRCTVMNSKKKKGNRLA